MPPRSRVLHIGIVSCACLLAMSLIVMWILRARTTAQVTQCRNNLRIVAQALCNYADMNNDAFPSGTVANSTLPPPERISYLFSTLPFIDNFPAWKYVDRKESWRSTSNAPFLDVEMPFYLCPAGRETMAEGFAVTHFIGCAGVGRDVSMVESASDPRVGSFGYDRVVHRTDITDGLASTFLLIETTSHLGPWAAGGTSTIRPFDPGKVPYFGLAAPFGSFHASGKVNASFADGSVRSLSRSMDAVVLEAMATIAGGEEFPEW